MDDFLSKAISFYLGNVLAYFIILIAGLAMGFFTVRKASTRDTLVAIGLGVVPVLNMLSILAMIEEIKFAYEQRKWRRSQAELQAAIEEAVG